MQVVLHSGVSSTFHFINKNGQQAQVQDRDNVKEMLQSLLPKFKRKIDKELEEKNKVLSSNPALLQLYKDLVMTDIVTSEEFWAQHAPQYTQKQKQPTQDIGKTKLFFIHSYVVTIAFLKVFLVHFWLTSSHKLMAAMD